MCVRGPCGGVQSMCACSRPKLLLGGIQNVTNKDASETAIRYWTPYQVHNPQFFSQSCSTASFLVLPEGAGNIPSGPFIHRGDRSEAQGTMKSLSCLMSRLPLEIAICRSTAVIKGRDGQRQHSDRQWCLNDAKWYNGAKSVPRKSP